jgi:glycosyltransferase involved in cell wall biosynthesis
LKIAILGIRGIPNRHGGFDRAAEELSVRLAKMGHDVTVYNTDDHPFDGPSWHGVNIKRVFSREQSLGIIGTFLFDYLSLKDAVNGQFDIIFELGHYPSAIFFSLLRHTQAILITNIDGLCWMRPKWSRPIRRFILHCEQTAVRQSHALIADHPAIQAYCLSRYGKHAHHIAYGAVIPRGNNLTQLEYLGLKAREYFILVARLEPENNIEMILDGYLASNSSLPFVVVGELNTRHSKNLVKKYKNKPGVRFVGAIYDYEALSGLRQHSQAYFHGHSVGGTTPSLLEAMACQATISAHDNPFNRGILDQDAHYFSSPKDITQFIAQGPQNNLQQQQKNLAKIRQRYNWDLITHQHEQLFYELLGRAASGQCAALKVGQR